MQYRKRLTFHLTPLLDLLLIVIFAQYMEVQLAAGRGASLLRHRQAELEAVYQQHVQQLEAVAAADKIALEADRARFSEQFQSIIEQQRQAGTALTEAFNLPARIVKEALRLQSEGQTGDATRLQQAVSHLRDVLESKRADLLRFVIRYDEMQKHVSVWELHLQDNGQGMFTDGAIMRRLLFESPEEFAAQCFEASKAFEEPRPLTLILMTWADTQAGFRRSAIDGLPLAVQRLRDGSSGTRWYDYSLIGFRPDGPLINADSADGPPRESESRE